MQIQLIVLLACINSYHYISCQQQNKLNSTETSNTTIATSNRLIKSFDHFISKYNKKITKNKSIFNKKTNKTLDQTSLIFQLSKLGRQKPSSLKAKKPQSKKPESKGISQIRSVYNTVKNGLNQAYYENINTIRMVPSTKVESSKKLYFLFNLSLISPTEKLVKSDLYINRKYIKQKLEFNLHYFLYSSLNNKRSLNVTTASVNQKRSAAASGSSATLYLKNLNSNHQTWQSFNIYDSVKSYLDMRNSKHAYQMALNKSSNKNIYYTFNQEASQVESDELVLIMEATNLNTNKNRKRVNLSEILNPYLMIYTQEVELNMKNFFQNRVSTSLMNRLALKSADNELEELKQFESEVDKQNEQNDSSEFAATTTLAAQVVSKLNTTKLSQIETYLIEKSKLNDPYFNYLPKALKKRDAESSEHVFDEKFLPVDQSALLASDSNKCGTKSILIDFDDMSFSDWIIEPKRFTSNYCSGICKLGQFNQVSLN